MQSVDQGSRWRAQQAHAQCPPAVQAGALEAVVLRAVDGRRLTGDSSVGIMERSAASVDRRSMEAQRTQNAKLQDGRGPCTVPRVRAVF
jgi:hypothetical protein